MTEKIFITGGGGCVGHYLFDELAKRDDLDLTFLIRSPEKVKYSLKGINVIKDDFKNIKKYEDMIKDSDYVIHLLADWGNEDGNYGQTIDFFNCIDPSKVKKVIYFSTASILGKDNKSDKRVLSYGTGYIRGKYKTHVELQTSPLKDKIITLYPTWVLGGDRVHPYSHAYTALKNSKKWLPFLTFLDSDLKFHFIHAADIAKIAVHLLLNEVKENEFVLGNKVITAGEFIGEIGRHFGLKRPFRIKITGSFAKIAGKLFGNMLSAWDRYCLDTYHQEFRTTDPSSFGLKTAFPTAKSIVDDIFGGK